MTQRIGHDQLTGDIAEQGLPDILQLLHARRRDGQLLVEEPAERGRPPRSASVYVRQGEVVHALCPPYSGELAFHAVLGIRRGRFAFLGQAIPDRDTINLGFRQLLMESMRRMDEEQRLRLSLPPLGAALFPAYRAEAMADLSMPWRCWRLLEMVDGRRDVSALTACARYDPLEVLEDLRRLLAAGALSTTADTGFLAQVVLTRSDAAHDPRYPRRRPGPMGVHLLRQLDGHRDLSLLAQDLHADAHELIAAAREVLREGWAECVQGAEIWQERVG